MTVRSETPVRSRRGFVVGLSMLAVVLMLAAGVPGPNPAAVFPRFYSIELSAALLHVGLYLGLLAHAGTSWLRLVMGETGSVTPRLQAGAGLLAGACVAALVPVDAVRLIGGPPTDLFVPAVWVDGVTSELVAAAITVAVGLGLSLAVAVVGRNLPWPVQAVGPFIALLAPLWLGHSRTETPRALMIVADVVHLVGAAWWLSGLLVFAVLLFVGARAGQQPVAVADGVGRFSRIALLAAVAVASSGLLMSLLIVEGPGDYLGTSWGRALLVKVVVVGGVVALARWNVRNISDVVRRRDGSDAQWSALRLTMTSELCLILGAVFITGFLTQLSPG